MHEFDVIPLATINVWTLDPGVRYKGPFGDFDWFGVTAAIHFGSWYALQMAVASPGCASHPGDVYRSPPGHFPGRRRSSIL